MPDSTPAITRRGVLAVGGAAILGAVGGLAAGVRLGEDATSPEIVSASGSQAVESPLVRVPAARPIAFHGPHQSGVETEPALLQTYLGLDLTDDDRETAAAALTLLTDDAARLMAGEPALGDPMPELARQPDQLSITVGLGHSLFRRTGLSDRIPEWFPEIPSFPTDALDPAWGDTDLVVQVGANDPVTLSHTLRTLTKDLSTIAHVRWTQSGFRSAAAEDTGVIARRNLMGQVEGTHFPQPGSPQFAQVVWADDGPDWAVGGTVLVLRRIRMLFNTWDRMDRAAQETVMGRRLSDGALLGSDGASSPFDALDANGLPVIPTDAHVRVARADDLSGVIMRRPYNYDSGLVDGEPDSGLLFAAYTRDPRASFIPTQERLSSGDAFHRWIRTVGSATYLLPGGVAPGEALAQGLFA